MTTSKMTLILKEPQSQITHVEINLGCIITICAAIVLVVGIICLFAYFLINKKKQDSIKTLLKEDTDIKNTLVEYISADKEILKKIVNEIWTKKESEIKEEIVKKYKEDKEIREYLEKKTQDQLRELILDALKKGNDQKSEKHE